MFAIEETGQVRVDRVVLSLLLRDWARLRRPCFASVAEEAGKRERLSVIQGIV